MQTVYDPKIPNLLESIYFDSFGQLSEESLIETDTKKKKNNIGIFLISHNFFFLERGNFSDVKYWNEILFCWENFQERTVPEIRMYMTS